jgi:leucyl/phenylalanyl-tRNA--protein transferase
MYPISADIRMIPWLDTSDSFPPVTEALRNPNGLLAAGADLSAGRLLDAYARGIFPWFSEDDPPLWWSPDPRMVLWLNELHISRSLRRTIRSGRYEVTLDKAFRDVMVGCAEPREDCEDTWITSEMIDAYTALSGLGFGHSVEVWSGTDLAGGLYGVALGRMFYGESMFSRVTDASKVALAVLIRQLARWNFELIDCQLATTHLQSLGAREIPRTEFLRHVDRLSRLEPIPSPWTLDEDVLEGI